jgi:hypothetical protein
MILFNINRRRRSLNNHLSKPGPQHLGLVVLICFFLNRTAEAQGSLTAVFPSAALTQDQVGLLLPFGGGDVQSIYSGSALALMMPSGGTITQIAFRVDGPFGNSVNATVPDIEIHLSTTPVNPADISNFFAQNRGPDETVVLPRGSLHFQSSWSNPGPNPFALTIPLSKSFTYDPKGGNLLLEMFIFQAATGSRIPLDGTVVDASKIAGRIGSDEADLFGGGSAPVLQLTFFPIPEPRVSLILTIGLTSFVLMGKAKKCR